jgi:hypothetical protein
MTVGNDCNIDRDGSCGLSGTDLPSVSRSHRGTCVKPPRECACAGFGVPLPA